MTISPQKDQLGSKNSREEREAVHHSFEAKGRVRRTKKNTPVARKTQKKADKKVREGFSTALASFFSVKKTPSTASLPKKFVEPETLQAQAADAQSDRTEPKVRTSRSLLRFVLLFASFLGIAAVLVPWTPRLPTFLSRADAVRLYPSTCLGGWENPMNAEGVPSLPLKSSSDQFNDRNSAVLRDALAQIFCGGFINAFPEGAFPKKMFLKFSWATVAPPVISSAEAHDLKMPTMPFSSTTGEVLDGPFIVTDEMSGATSTDTHPSQRLPTDPLEASSTETLSDEQAPVSFFKKFLNVAFAASASGTPAKKNEQGEFLTATGTPQETNAPSSPETEKSGTFPDNQQFFGADFLQVLYTLDGQNWKHLGMVTRENLADLSFQVPVSDPETLSRFQVSIQNVMSLDDSPAIYLDALWLEAGE
ncbi:MAG: hypothetical protein HYT94_04685 [Parcubacteria group bacterium]|nr:hypothetical protein [Parcubacteria group bacterium]